MKIVLKYYPIDEPIADIFTKSFTENKFTYLCSLLGVSSSRWSDYFQCSAWGGGFTTRFSLFSSLRFTHDLILRIVWVSLLYRVTYGLSFWGPSISCTLRFYSYEYSLTGGFGDIYPPCTLNLVNLSLLKHYPKFYWLNQHQMSTLWHHHEHTHAYLQ